MNTGPQPQRLVDWLNDMLESGRVGTLFVPTRVPNQNAWAKYCFPTLRD